MIHIPVLLKETIAALDPAPNENFIDGTFGRGGHSKAILEKTAPKGIILGIERDRESIAALPREIRENPRLIIANGSYGNIESIARQHHFKNIKGVLFDLGMSSWHLDESGKGFSFSKDEPLDMRYDSGAGITAKQIVNNYPQEELEKIFKDFGQEKNAKKIAAAIVAARRKKEIATTRDLSEIVRRPPGSRSRASAARIFQSLRIAVNDELDNARKGIAAAFKMLEPGGRIAAISFHSLEDKIVKEEFKKLAGSNKARLLFKKPLAPRPEEIAANPRCASAKLRAIEKIV